MTEQERFNSLIEIIKDVYLTFWVKSIIDHDRFGIFKDKLSELKYPEKSKQDVTLNPFAQAFFRQFEEDIKKELEKREKPAEKPKQSKFEIGDTVNIYTDNSDFESYIIQGIVKQINIDSTLLGIELSHNNKFHQFHIKQCRRLREKEKV